MSVWRTYRQLLRNRPLSRLLFGEFVSSIGDWLYLVALVVLVYRETQDPFILGIVGAARLLPYVFLSIPAGIISDRFDRRLVLLVSDLARGACMLVLAGLVIVDADIVLVAAVVMVSACFSPLFYPAIGALIPSLVHDEAEYGPANSAWATLDNLAWIIGPGIAGLILVFGSIEFAFLLNAVTFAVVGVVLWSLPPAKPEPLPIPDQAADAAPGAGVEWRMILGRRVPASIDLSAVTGVVLLEMLAWFAFGGINILIVILAIDVFQGGDAATGFLSAATGVGGTLGAILSGVLVLRPRLGPSILLAAAAFGAAVLLLGIAPALVVAFVAIAVASVAHLVLDVARTTILQRVVPDAYRGRFSGVLMTSSGGAEALGTLAVPILAALFGLGVVLPIVGVALFAGAVLSVVLIGRSADLDAGAHDAELRRIARLPVFGGLSAARVEGALRQLEPIRVSAGDVVIREGDVADRFFVIASGRFEVSQGGGPAGAAGATGAAKILRTLGRHDVFGERGLLRGQPRTATVTALDEGLLFVMDGAAFLAMVGARRGVADRLLALYEPGETPSRA
ncbi:MAG TPA: MFS transporter [Candidatus Limnocylindria bacterium]|nr:MFS transporter [Candidatus Limnocylindria bacterium]